MVISSVQVGNVNFELTKLEFITTEFINYDESKLEFIPGVSAEVIVEENGTAMMGGIRRASEIDKVLISAPYLVLSEFVICVIFSIACEGWHATTL